VSGRSFRWPCDGAALLVSVRAAFEARDALAGGAAIIDVKEPRSGSLGAPARRVLEAVVGTVAGRVPVTCALGELGETSDAVIDRLTRVRGVALVKIGLAGRRGGDWDQELLYLRARLRSRPHAPDLVAVAYADAQVARAPSIGDVVALAVRERFPALLVDTFVKDGKTLFDAVSLDDLASLVRSAQQAGVRVVLAGSLTVDRVDDIVALGADAIAVRGAVTTGARDAAICRRRVEAFVAALREETRATPGPTRSPSARPRAG